MTQEQKTATLKTILRDVLADLAFMFSDDELAEPRRDDIWLEVSVHYRGSAAGKLQLLCTRGFSIRLARNMLGIQTDHSDTDQHGDDAVKELLNVVCGHTLTALHDTDTGFELTAPSVRVLQHVPETFHADVEESVTMSFEHCLLQLRHVAK
jgi:CheY-specific phosphatase CheX